MSRFERHIRRNLRNHSTEFDTSSLWESIKEDIPSENPKKKRFIVFFLYGVICLGLASITGHGIVEQFAKSSSFISKQQNAMAWLDDSKGLFPEFDISHNVLENNEETALVSTKLQTTVSNISSSSNISIPNSEELSTVQSTNEVLSTPLKIISPQKENALVLQDKVEEEEAIELEAVELSSPIAAILLDESPKTISPISLIIDELEEEEEENEESKEKSNGAFTVSMGVHTSYGNANSTIVAKSDAQNEYAFNRKSTENTKNFVSTGIDIKLVHQKGFTIRTGISYSRITETIGHFNNNPTVNSYPSSDNLGSSIAQFNIGPTEAEVTNASGNSAPSTNGSGRAFLSNSRTLRFTDIPLMMGYQAKINHKFFVGFEIGPYFNLNSSSDGGILLENGRQIPLSNGAINPFKRNIILSSFTSLNASYQMNDDFSLNLGAQYRFTPFSVTKSDYTLTQRYSSMGFSLGFLYRIK